MTPGVHQVWVVNGSYASFADVVEVYPDHGIVVPDSSVRHPSDMAHRESWRGVSKVGYRPLLEDASGEITVIGIDAFASSMTPVIDLADWLPSFRSINPGWTHPGAPDRVRMHQIWEVGSQNRYVRVTKPGVDGPEARMEWTEISPGLTRERRETGSRNSFTGRHRFCFNLVDLLRILRSQVDVEQGRARGPGRIRT